MSNTAARTRRTAAKAIAAPVGRRNKTTAAEAEHRVYTIHSLDELEVSTGVRRLPTLDADEARSLTEQIKATTVRLWLLVTEAHDRKAHLALGYETWADYCKAELKISESRSYQFLDTGHVMKALAAAGVDIETVEVPPTRVVARIKDRLTDVKKAASEVVKRDEKDMAKAIDKSLRHLAREPRKAKKTTGSAPATTGAAAAAASAGAPEETKVQCPACRGSGKVPKSRASLIKELMAKIRSS